ncbi:MAG: NADH oxidase [bacterium ADurb.Bin236]|nr:MAG: NADH oxidase [bacterium ADurb.Bin236]HOY62460.1 hypothetical protein [bacterium]HPN95246.1 hypothetical protein [bacterium]
MDEYLSYLARPADIGGRQAKNRLSTLPMEANDSEPDGSPSEITIERYRRLSAGGWGVVYVEALASCERGRCRPRQLMLSKRNLDSFKRLSDAIRAASDTPPFIIYQINHGGRYALRPLVSYHSEILDPTWDMPEGGATASTAELDEAADATAETVKLCASAGADAADLKCCHGYLAAELFRPSNNRDDKYGGSLENRLRFMDALISAGAEAARDDGLIFGSRISIQEKFPGGIGSSGPDGTAFDFSGVAPLLERLKAAGAAFVCETMGVPYYNPETTRPQAGRPGLETALAEHHGMAGWVKSFNPAFAVIGAGYTSLKAGCVERAAKNIIAGDVDIIGFGRQSFADPDTAVKLLSGDAARVKWCAACGKNNCSTLLRAKAPAGCVVHDRAYRAELKKIQRGK